MFNKPIDDRLSSWADHRKSLENSIDPLSDVWDFWKHAPYIPYNHKIDPYHQRSWPSPWEIIVHNQYDDFTKSLMIAWSLKLTNRYKQSKIEIRTVVDKLKNVVYNIVYINGEFAINYNDYGPVLVKDIPDTYHLENLVEIN